MVCMLNNKTMEAIKQKIKSIFNNVRKGSNCGHICGVASVLRFFTSSLEENLEMWVLLRMDICLFLYLTINK